MKYLFAKRNASVLDVFAQRRVLLAFDFDGTLAPIVRDRDAARMSRRTKDLLANVCELYPCAVISGRSRKDVASRLVGTRVKHVVGNHGLEPGENLDPIAMDIARVRAELESMHTRADIEDKRFSLAVHFRRPAHAASLRTAIRAAARAAHAKVRVTAGKLVINIVPVRGENKGDALVLLKKKTRAQHVMYIGDDVTDEDVFLLGGMPRLVTVRVGRSRSSAAEYFVREQTEVNRVLAALIAIRTAGVS